MELDRVMIAWIINGAYSALAMIAFDYILKLPGVMSFGERTILMMVIWTVLNQRDIMAKKEEKE